jgi:hypothetical protein
MQLYIELLFMLIIIKMNLLSRFSMNHTVCFLDYSCMSITDSLISNNNETVLGFHFDLIKEVLLQLKNRIKLNHTGVSCWPFMLAL